MKSVRRVTTGRDGRAGISRLLAGLMAVGLTVLFLGCTAAPAPLKKLSPFGANSQDESLRKRVEADPFPTAKQAGLSAAQ